MKKSVITSRVVLIEKKIKCLDFGILIPNDFFKTYKIILWTQNFMIFIKNKNFCDHVLYEIIPSWELNSPEICFRLKNDHLMEHDVSKQIFSYKKLIENSDFKDYKKNFDLKEYVFKKNEFNKHLKLFKKNAHIYNLHTRKNQTR